MSTTPTLPALLLLHGVGDSGECWGPFVARLRALPGLADLVVAAPDAPAHGGRRAEPGHTVAWPDQLAEAVGHAEQLVTATGRPIVVGGHSMGAMVALGVAASRPDLVVATFLEDPPLQHALPPAAGPDSEDPQPDVPVDVSEFGQWFESLRAIPLAEVIAAARADHPTWDHAEYEPWARAKQQADPDAFARPVVWLHAQIADRLRRTPPPVVVVAGLPERGGLVADAAAASLSTLEGWAVHRVDAGHDVRRDAPEPTARLLADLLRSAAHQPRR